MNLIGIAGPAGCGKSTAAGFLASALNERGYLATLYAFAVGLKREARLQHGWTGEKTPFWREWMQRRGAWARKSNPNVWVEALDLRAQGSGSDFVVIPDLRFENEAHFCRLHGVVWHVSGRAADLPKDLAAHESERGIEAHADDVRIQNAGRLEDLKAAVLLAVTEGLFQFTKQRPDFLGATA